jgi:enoyl-CoA hydratase/carnithine racemase
VNSVQLERMGRIALLRLDRPPANAIDLELAKEFSVALEGIDGSDAFDALIITGVGNCFCAGLDLKALPSYNRPQQEAMIMQLNHLFGGLYGLRLPTIAAVNGHAIAGGVILTLACDYRIGAQGDYKIGLAEARVGVPFPVSAMSIAQSELRPDVARSMVLTARNSNPQEAKAMGVLDELLSPDLLIPRSVEVAEEMAALPKAMFSRIKSQLRAAALSRIEDAMSHRKEPMLDSWLSEETRVASAEALKHRS